MMLIKLLDRGVHMQKCKTKLVATLGPASSDYETIKELAKFIIEEF